MTNMGIRLVGMAVLALAGGCATASGTTPGSGRDRGGASGDAQAEIREIVASYHRALEAGDREAAIGLLSPEAMVLESGHVETREEYLAHHLDADMEFSAAVSAEREVLTSIVEGDAGWVVSTSRSSGQFRGSKVDTAGAELMVLRRQGGAWMISAIHWSSRRLKP